MKPESLLALYLAVFAAEFLLDWLLDILNLNASLRNRGEVPEAFRDTMDEEHYRRGIEYTLRKGSFGLLRSLWSRGLIILVLATGAAGLLDGIIGEWGLTAYWHGVAFIAAASAAIGMADLPASLYARFVIEEEFGFNTAGIRTFLSDSLKEGLVGAVLLMVLFALLRGAVSWMGPRWWLAAWVFWTVFQFLLVVLYPTLIAPLFNRFEPLPDGSLKDRLDALADRQGFANRGIYVMDGSRRSRHSNAHFTGLGRFRRIVLFDTLIDNLEEDELEAVLAHEIGHWKHGHIRRRLAVSVGLTLGFFALAGLLLTWKPLYEAFRIGPASLHGLMFWMMFFASPLTALASPLGNVSSRRHEYQADRFAASCTGGSDAMRRALLALGRDNLSNLTPHPAYSFWHYSHPAPAERLAALQEGEVSAPSESREKATMSP